MNERIVPRPEAIELNVDGLTLAGIRHRSPGADAPVRLLCLHGWLDNANSFLPLMPFLPNVDLVAIDLPGHGFSGHLDACYALPELTYWACAAMKALGWENCHLAGHSLGGIIAPLVAVAMPEKISSLLLIEAAGAITSEADDFSKRLGASIAERLNEKKFASRIYASKDEAVSARLSSTRMALSSAQLIIDRQIRQTEDGWVWRFDRKLRITTAHRLTEEHVQNVNRHVDCPIISIVAKQGFLVGRKNTDARMSLLKEHQIVSLTGHHHLHMDTPEPVAAAINQFLDTQPDMGG